MCLKISLLPVALAAQFMSVLHFAVPVVWKELFAGPQGKMAYWCHSPYIRAL